MLRPGTRLRQMAVRGRAMGGSSVPSNALRWDDNTYLLWDDLTYLLWD